VADSRLFSFSTPASLCEIEKNIDKFFISYARHSYRAEIRSGAQEWQDPSPIKLHISISKDDIARVQLDFIKLLLNAIAEGIINEFKHTCLDTVYDELKIATDDIEKISLFRSYLVGENVIIPEDKNEIGVEWEDFSSKYRENSCTDKALLATASDLINLYKVTILRLIEGSQFTIYLPLKYNLAGIAKLKNNISKIQIEKKVEGGKMTLAQSALDDLVSLRLETLDGEYVSAITSDKAILDRLQEIQTSSELFKYLKLHAGDAPLSLKEATLDIRECSSPCEDPFEIKISLSLS